MLLRQLDSQFLRYLAEQELSPGETLPTLSEIGAELGISVGKLREQLEVARSLGLVSVRPRVGIQREPFDFARAISNSVMFGLATCEAEFAQLSQMRRALEASFWPEAVVLLDEGDIGRLRQIVAAAWTRLRQEPIHVPNGEHRQLHLLIFSRLDNPFVQGWLETYWDAYEASELTRFASYQYWLEVWTYHERIVEAVAAGKFEVGRRLLLEHFTLLSRQSSLLEPALPAVDQQTLGERQATA